MNEFYIYIYLDPRKSGRYCYNDFCFLFEPIYVGKGKDGRYKEIKWNRNPHFKNIINKIKKYGSNPIIFKLYENLSEEKSFELETKSINEIGRIDLEMGSLVNMTDGGEGMSGHITSNETKKKLSKINKGKLSGVNNPNFGKPLSKETKDKISEKTKGENNPFHKLTEEQVIQIKLLLKEGILTQQEIADMFGVDKSTISCINCGITWSYIKV